MTRPFLVTAKVEISRLITQFTPRKNRNPARTRKVHGYPSRENILVNDYSEGAA